MEDNTVTTVEPKEKTAQTEKAEKAVKKDKKEKKPSFFKGLKKEFKKIVFADKQTVAKQTVAVVTMSIFIGALIAVLDYVLKFGLGFIL
ncbi:MAG: preprotein translocase subunit SecE [Clostridium sp.]|nr:preprotein translocase subunit SecE [Clostridium sp.]